MKKQKITLFLKRESPCHMFFEVDGYHAFDLHGYSFVVHRETEYADGEQRMRSSWKVSEVTCGACVTEASATRAAAIADAKQCLGARTQEQIDAAIRRKLLERAKTLLGE